jgi:hypothetical protein
MAPPSTDWSAEINPTVITGFDGRGADNGSGGVTGGVVPAQGTKAIADAPLWSPDNPLFWFGGLLAITAGLFALSVNVKAGPAKAAASI